MSRLNLYILLLSTLLHLTACSRKTEEVKTPPAIPSGVADLSRYPQRINAYAGTNAESQLITPKQQQEFDTVFNRNFFAPWHQRKASLPADTAFWGIAHYQNKEGFGANLLPFPAAEWQRLVALQQIASYPSLARAAITVRNTSMRLMPTDHPFFLDPAKAGEGFPFDYFQTSALSVGNPLLATHRSSDGAWIFVESNVAFGWVPADAIAWTDASFRKRYESGKYAAILKDDTSLRSERGEFLTQADLGALFPVQANRKGSLRLLIPVRGSDATAQLRVASPPATTVSIKPLPLTRGAISRLADPLLGQMYGWGGLYEYRDCSAMMRDLFVPFGLWLGRNSQTQGRQGGEFHDLTGRSAADKRQSIISDAIPFITLILFKGHVGLYLGQDVTSGEPLLLHNTWGVHTLSKDGKEGREIIGRLVITGLRPGEERPDVVADAFYDRIQGYTIMTRRNGL